MKKSESLIAIADRFGAHNYHPLPVVLSRGLGSKVWDVEGKEYLDFLSCYSALNFGHQHPELISTLKEQAEKLTVVSRAFHSDQLCLFVKELADFCEMEGVLPMNSGAEAVETAIKIARKWAYKKRGIEDGKIIVMENNFHGRTITVISFSTEHLYREGFGPFTPGFEAIPFGNVESLEKVVDDKTIAILSEPIQAEAGILIPPTGYLTTLRKFCDKHELLLMFDEIQTGLGRTGKDFCFQHEGAKPDVLILGKSLGGGLLPLSAAVGNREVMDILRPGEHGSTFGGNPLASAIGITVLKILREEKLSERSRQLGKEVMAQLKKEPLPRVKEIRGMGLLIGIELDDSAGGARRYCEKLAEEGVLCKETHENVIRIAPPLNIEKDLLETGVQRIIDIIKRM